MLPVFVINLERRPDRWERISEHLRRLNIRATRVPAIDARTLAALDGEWSKGKGELRKSLLANQSRCGGRDA